MFLLNYKDLKFCLATDLINMFKKKKLKLLCAFRLQSEFLHDFLAQSKCTQIDYQEPYDVSLITLRFIVLSYQLVKIQQCAFSHY